MRSASPLQGRGALRRGAVTFWESQPREATVGKTFGIILIVLGLLGLAYGGFSYTTNEKVVDIGPIHATREKTHNVPVAPIAGALALVGGIVLLAVGRKTTA
jgi:uncharacterized membrane protein YidH (DUF202 family)